MKVAIFVNDKKMNQFITEMIYVLIIVIGKGWQMYMNNRDTNQRTGIKTGSKASDAETMNFMYSKAVQAVQDELPYFIQEVDHIIFASYTPSDAIGTAIHYIQREFDIKKTTDLICISVSGGLLFNRSQPYRDALNL